METVLIGLSGRAKQNGRNRIYFDNDSYFNYIRTCCNCIPFLIEADNEEQAALYAQTLDGLLITGGQDVNPELYEESNFYSESIDPHNDRSDILLYNAFRELGKPILGICRGEQIINVIEGGSLYQDINHQTGIRTEHNQLKIIPVPASDACSHSCTFIDDTVMHAIFGDLYQVNSYHHQAIKVPASGFVVSAYAEDGTIEAIEKDNILAVQWHPERLLNDSKHLEIMKHFIKNCLLAKQSVKL